jgi:hypothetical protein
MTVDPITAFWACDPNNKKEILAKTSALLKYVNPDQPVPPNLIDDIFEQAKNTGCDFKESISILYSIERPVVVTETPKRPVGVTETKRPVGVTASSGNIYDALASLVKKEPPPTLDEVKKFLDLHEVRNLNGYDSGGNPPLVWPIVVGREDIVTEFCKRNADINMKTKKGNAILFICFHPLCPDYFKAVMWRLVLSKGADPNVKDCDGKGVDDYPLSFQMLYWLNRAREKMIFTPEKRNRYKDLKILPILEANFSLVGQELGTDLIIERILAKRGDPNRDKAPVSLFLVGPPGHGKSEIASSIGELLDPGDHVKINCGSIVDGKWGLFGSDPGYVGSGQGTDLSNFIKTHHGRFGVVILEEFEKLGNSAREALLHPLSSGEWANKESKPATPFDCSQIIFFFTSNLINQQITERLESSGLIVKLSAEKNSQKKSNIRSQIVKFVEDMVKEELIRRGPPEFARRVEVIPFIQLSPLEQKIIVISEQDKLTARYKKPPTGEIKFGNTEINFSEDFSDYVLKYYDKMQGASSLKDPVRRAVDSVLSSDHPESAKVWIYVRDGVVQKSFGKPPEKEEEEEDPMDTEKNSSVVTSGRTPFIGNVKPVENSF